VGATATPVIPFEERIDLEVETPSDDPSLWLLASEGREAVGALSGVVSGDRGWVGELGVRAPWRGRGVATARLHRSFATFAARGLRRVMLNVDSENSTGAVRLYERVGMRTARVWDVYEKRVV
jgi:ribosomal protein S18 acetylase RimI-like enzyme